MPVASGAPPPSPMASGAEPKTGGRRVSKPLMEKRRRARINRCLNQLKAFLVDPSKPESPRQSKLEKADILEMTVCHLQALHRQRRTARLLDDPEVRQKFRAGFEECILEIRRFLCSLAEQHQTPLGGCCDPVAARERILGHLQRRAREIRDPDGALAQCTSTAAGPDTAVDPPARPSRRPAHSEAATPESSHSSLDTTASSDELASETSSSRSPSPSDVVVSHADVRLRPKRLRNGDLVLVLPRDLVANARIVAAASAAESDVKTAPLPPRPSTSGTDVGEVPAASTSPDVVVSSSTTAVTEEPVAPPAPLPPVSSSPTSSSSAAAATLLLHPSGVEVTSHDDVWRPW
ncbi:uncharacterized protein [Dermacentor andersoni]|uniref:uncharacterized protein n=1 Tax=Dermacentor andersoni TaxID=34620 RepID=UPI002155AF27|nr:transcription factor HES-1-like [Dermacentor andersoni]